MKVKKFFVIVSIASTALTACGGSSDDGAGQLSPFQVAPDNVEIQAAGATCPLTKAGEFAVIGGTAPYTVLSPFHQLVAFGPPGGAASSTVGNYTVPNRNGQFAIYIQGCFEPAVVTVMDDLERVATIEVSYVASAAN